MSKANPLVGLLSPSSLSSSSDAPSRDNSAHPVTSLFLDAGRIHLRQSYDDLRFPKLNLAHHRLTRQLGVLLCGTSARGRIGFGCPSPRSHESYGQRKGLIAPTHLTFGLHYDSSWLSILKCLSKRLINSDDCTMGSMPGGHSFYAILRCTGVPSPPHSRKINCIAHFLLSHGINECSTLLLSILSFIGYSRTPNRCFKHK